MCVPFLSERGKSFLDLGSFAAFIVLRVQQKETLNLSVSDILSLLGDNNGLVTFYILARIGSPYCGVCHFISFLFLSVP